MRPWMRVVVVVLLLSTSAASGGTDLPHPDELKRLEAGEPVVRTRMAFNASGGRAGEGRAYIVIDRPPDVVWRFAQDYERFVQSIPRLKKVVVLERALERLRVFHLVGLGLRSLRYTLDVTFHPSERMVSWQLDKSRPNDIHDTTGTWRFIPHGPGRTLAVYTISLDTGFPLPPFLEDYITTRDLPQMLRAVKRGAESLD
ncbi:MAG: SRPBCC family protein [Myxococcota bacterium]